MPSKKNMKGGDGYAVNVMQSIAGRPSYIRYTDNCRPVFQGSLLQDPKGQALGALGSMQNGGFRESEDQKKYESILDSRGELVQQGGKKDCGCDKKDDSIFALLKKSQQNKQSGGFVGELSQFAPIQAVSKILSPMGTTALTAMIVLVFLHYYMKKRGKGKKAKMMGGASGALESVLAPLGRANLLVLAGILLLHHFAMTKLKKSKSLMMMKGGKKKITKQRGGSIQSVLEQLLAPLGVNALGASIVLVGIRQAFMKKKKMRGGSKKNEWMNQLSKSLKKMKAKQLVAGGVFRSMEKLFDKKMKMEMKQTEKAKMQMHQSFDELFQMVGPVTYSTFATQKTQKKADNIRNFISKKNKS